MTEESIGNRLVRLAAGHPELATLTRAALAKRLGMSYETLRKWQVGESGPSRRRAERIAAMLGVPTATLTHGVTYSMFPGRELIQGKSDQSGDGATVELAQPVSQENVIISLRPRLPAVEWRDGKMIKALKRFTVVAPDDTMAPAIVRGSTVIFDTSMLPARNGDYVLLKDMAGDWHIREYQGTPDGSWHALPQAERALTLESAKHGLEVLAIFDGTMGRRG